jgi:sulfate adenylyltransferase
MYAKSPRDLRATWGPDGAPIRDPHAVHVLWTRGHPSYGIDGPPHEVDKGIRSVLLGVCLLSQVRRVDFPKWAGQGVPLRPRGGRVSGSLLRGFFWRAFGRLLWLCVLVGVVVDWWRVYGHPFVSVKYLRS